LSAATTTESPYASVRPACEEAVPSPMADGSGVWTGMTEILFLENYATTGATDSPTAYVTIRNDRPAVPAPDFVQTAITL
jgi:hypothetical protein